MNFEWELTLGAPRPAETPEEKQQIFKCICEALALSEDEFSAMLNGDSVKVYAPRPHAGQVTSFATSHIIMLSPKILSRRFFVLTT